MSRQDVRAAVTRVLVAVDQWNRAVQVGDEVDYRLPTLNDPPRRTTTRTPASVLGGHSAVVWLDGVGGCVALSHCAPVAKEQP